MAFRKQEIHNILIKRIKETDDPDEKKELSEVLSYINRLEAVLLKKRDLIYELAQDLRRRRNIE